eukprot:1158800-Pelagomonas_calceolata.AAC.14
MLKCSVPTTEPHPQSRLLLEPIPQRACLHTFLRSQSEAFSMSMLHSARAFLQSIMPAPDLRRSSCTALEETCREQATKRIGTYEAMLWLQGFVPYAHANGAAPAQPCKIPAGEATKRMRNSPPGID